MGSSSTKEHKVPPPLRSINTYGSNYVSPSSQSTKSYDSQYAHPSSHTTSAHGWHNVSPTRQNSSKYSTGTASSSSRSTQNAYIYASHTSEVFETKTNLYNQERKTGSTSEQFISARQRDMLSDNNFVSKKEERINTSQYNRVFPSEEERKTPSPFDKVSFGQENNKEPVSISNAYDPRRRPPQNINAKAEYLKKSVPSSKNNLKTSVSILENSQSLFRTPEKFNTKADLLMQWFIWREEFNSYKKGMIDTKSDNNTNWALLLLNYMGQVGQEIYRTFSFCEHNEKEDVDVLLRKFDCYVLFYKKKKESHETVEEYIEDLRGIIMKRNNACTISYMNELLKEKILQDVEINQFKKVASELIPSFRCESNVNVLTLPQIIKIWKVYEAPTQRGTDCSKCGSFHSFDKCPARGQQCRRCKELNHYASVCKSLYVKDCDYCGRDHKIKQCPAYQYTCTKCQRKNHFEIKCKGDNPMIKCRFCGCEHIASKNACPAKAHLCARCNRVGHFPSRCSYLD